MTDATVSVDGKPGLQSEPSVASDASVASSVVDGREARPALVTLVPSGGAPVCEGDACSFEVPD